MRITNVWGAFLGLFILLAMWFGFSGFFVAFIETMFTGVDATVAYLALTAVVLMTLFGIITSIAQDDGAGQS